MKNYYRLRLGRQFAHIQTCYTGNFIGVDDDEFGDLTGQLPEDWRTFNQKWVPLMVTRHPDMSKISAGLSCGTLWTVAKGINQGDVVLCPEAASGYRVCEVTGDYLYAPGEALPHRRPVRWLNVVVNRESMTEGLRNSAGAPVNCEEFDQVCGGTAAVAGGLNWPIDRCLGSPSRGPE